MSKGIIVVSLICGLVFISFSATSTQVFAQGREYQRIRAETLPGGKVPVLRGEPEDSKAGTLPAERATIPSVQEGPSAEYLIASDDVLEVFVWQNPDLSKDVIVGPDGKISYPLVGTIQAAGLTVRQLEEKMRDGLSEYVKSPRVSVMMKQITGGKINKITILGEVSSPGVYTYRGTINLVEAIALAGDFREGAKGDRVRIVRGNLTENPEVLTIDMYRVIREGTSDTNIILKPNDVVYIPRSATAYGDKVIILGEVSYPGIYTFKGTINLIEVIALAGDFTEKARQDSVMIVRGNLTEKPEVMRINMLHAIRQGTSDIKIVLKPDDVVYVPKSFIANINKFLDNLRPTIDNALTVLDIRREIREIGGHAR